MWKIKTNEPKRNAISNNHFNKFHSCSDTYSAYNDSTKCKIYIIKGVLGNSLYPYQLCGWCIRD